MFFNMRIVNFDEYIIDDFFYLDLVVERVYNCKKIRVYDIKYLYVARYKEK